MDQEAAWIDDARHRGLRHVRRFLGIATIMPVIALLDTKNTTHV